MSRKIIIYAKCNSGEAPIPITLRLDWLADGTIKPLMFWTPDGVCYKILYQYDHVSLAFLKERGEGLRFKVLTEIIETPEPYSNILHAKYEVYLYLADRRFCEKNIIDERYSHTGKEYIPVTMDVFSDGDYELVYFKVREERYKVEYTLTIEPRGSFMTGGVGILHKVEARLVNADNDDDPSPRNSVVRLAALYLELNKWFTAIAKSA